MTFRFTQSDRPLDHVDGAEVHHLRAIEGLPAFARLSSGAGPMVAPLEYRLELVSDTGPSLQSYGAIMLVAFDVPQTRAAEVSDWYDNEHIALLMRGEGWLRARRFVVVDHAGKSWTSLTFHELYDISAMESEERRVARSTAWRARLEGEPWFSAAGRWVYVPW